MAMLRPPHPGEIIRHEVLEPLGVTVTAAAKALGVTRPALSNMLNGRAALSPEMALRIEKAFGPSMEHLMKMQLAYDIAQIRAREGSIRVRRYARTS
jgi:addiction module HigA family antidote